MTPNELYKLPPANVSHYTYPLRNFIPSYEVNFDRLPDQVEHLTLKYYANHCADGERVWELFSVWLRDTPIMICQQAGRSGRDYSNQFITNYDGYLSLIKLLQSLEEPDPLDSEPITDPDAHSDLLTEFYGNKLEQFYNPDLVTRYKVGDIVIASVPVNHLNYKKERVDTRCLIEKVQQYNPLYTYHARQLDRRWDHTKTNVMVYDKDHGSVYAHFSDNEVRHKAIPGSEYDTGEKA